MELLCVVAEAGFDVAQRHVLDVTGQILEPLQFARCMMKDKHC